MGGYTLTTHGLNLEVRHRILCLLLVLRGEDDGLGGYIVMVIHSSVGSWLYSVICFPSCTIHCHPLDYYTTYCSIRLHLSAFLLSIGTSFKSNNLKFRSKLLVTVYRGVTNSKSTWSSKFQTFNDVYYIEEGHGTDVDSERECEAPCLICRFR